MTTTQSIPVTTTTDSSSDQVREALSSCLTAWPDVLDARAMPVGQYARQGDVYIERLADDTEITGESLPNPENVALAVGSSREHRHVATGCEVRKQGDEFILTAKDSFIVWCDDDVLRHKPMQFAAGCYRAYVQREGSRELNQAVMD